MSACHRIDNAFVGAMMATIVGGWAFPNPAAGIALGFALALGAWGLLIEAPVAIIFGVVIPQPIVTSVRTLGGIGLAAVVSIWMSKTVQVARESGSPSSTIADSSSE